MSATLASKRVPLAVRLAALPLTAALVLLGVWIAGGVISDDFRISMGLTALWFAASGAAAVAVAWRTAPLRVPVLAGWVLTAAVVGIYLGFTTLRDPGDSFDGGADGNIDLGALKGNRGDQQYAIPRGAKLDGATVVIWCRAFSAPFGSARLS